MRIQTIMSGIESETYYESVDRLRVMLKQQETSYRSLDYFSGPQQSGDLNKEEELTMFRSPSALSVVEECAKLVTDISLIDHSGRSRLQPPVDPQLIPWRFQMCNWAYSVTDRLGYSHAIVATTFNIVDRYIAKIAAGSKVQVTMSSFDFQLICMSAFYIASKTNEMSDSIVSLEMMVEMSRGIFSVQNLVEAEQELLEVLDWRISPPTAYSFLGELFELWEEKYQKQAPEEWLSRSYRIVEITVGGAFFLKHLSSQQALAAMLVAGSESGESSRDLHDFCEEIRWIVDINDENFLAVYDELYSSPKDEVTSNIIWAGAKKKNLKNKKNH